MIDKYIHFTSEFLVIVLPTHTQKLYLLFQCFTQVLCKRCVTFHPLFRCWQTIVFMIVRYKPIIYRLDMCKRCVTFHLLLRSWQTIIFVIVKSKPYIYGIVLNLSKYPIILLLYIGSGYLNLSKLQCDITNTARYPHLSFACHKTIHDQKLSYNMKELILSLQILYTHHRHYLLFLR